MPRFQIAYHNRHTHIQHEVWGGGDEVIIYIPEANYTKISMLILLRGQSRLNLYYQDILEASIVQLIVCM